MSAAPPDRLSFATLDRLPLAVQRPAFDPRALKAGIVHLGVGAFHRAHQAVYTEDAIAAHGGDWGIVGVSLRRPDAAQRLCPQDCLYTLETRGEASTYRVTGALRDVLTASQQPAAVTAALAHPRTHILTLTVTEKAYALTSEGRLDINDTDIAHDIAAPHAPVSAIGWLALGLAQRFRAQRRPLTVLSCDNLSGNSHRLRAALIEFTQLVDPEAARWIEDAIRFPNTMVDCVVPATDGAALSRAEAVLGLRDAAVVQREQFSQWVIEDNFAGPRPAWDAVGAQLVADVAPYERMKLHVLNATHSALAYLGIPRGHKFVRQAIADADLAALIDEMVHSEIAPALGSLLPVSTYWRDTKKRFANPNIDHALAQIAEDGSKKLAVRLFPLLIENERLGRPTRRMGEVVRAWLHYARTNSALKDPNAASLANWARGGGDLNAALDDARLFPDAFRTDAKLRAAVVSGA